MGAAVDGAGVVGDADVGDADVGESVVGDAVVGDAVVGDAVVGALVGESVAQQVHNRLLLVPEGATEHSGLRVPVKTLHCPSLSSESVNPDIIGMLEPVPVP